MQKLIKKITAVFCSLLFAFSMMFSPESVFFRSGTGSPGWSATLIRAEEQPVTDESKGIAALLTLLFANGIRFVGEWENVSDGAVKLWNDFTTATGNTVTLAALGAGVAIQHGYMRTSATVNNAVNAFQGWYEGAFSVPSSGAVSIPVAEGGVGTYFPVSAGQCITINASDSRTHNYENWHLAPFAGVRAVILQSSATNSLYFVSESSFNVSEASLDSCGVAYQSAYNALGYYYYSISRKYLFSVGVVPVIQSSGTDYETAIYYTYGAGAANLPDISIEGQSYELKDGYNLNTDQSLLLDIANLSALVASIGLTLDSINDLVQDWPAIFDTPWADTDVPDITFPVPVVDTPDNTIPWVNVPDAVSPDPVPEYVPDTPAGEGEYRVLGLDKVFPFSIPFDLYYIATILVAEPETPSFTYAIYDPVNRQNVSMEVDFHRFDDIAALLRTLETLAFIAGLVFVTRGLIRS